MPQATTEPAPDASNFDLEVVPLLRLQGLREVTAERSPCSLVFEFATDEGRRVCIRIAEFVQIVQLLQTEGAIPELPWDWVYQMEGSYGFCLQAYPESHQDSCN